MIKRASSSVGMPSRKKNYKEFLGKMENIPLRKNHLVVVRNMINTNELVEHFDRIRAKGFQQKEAKVMMWTTIFFRGEETLVGHLACGN
jgi:hypothetical protein